jgi:hypothetical protein
VVPLLHTSERGRAAVVGLGTGVSARVAVEAGFRQIDVAELSPDMARMAERYFKKVNHGALTQPHVSLHIADGRNFLRLTSQRYDLIGAEISSIWFAGAATLYNREYYQIAHDHLTDRGVLEQWVQLHHLAKEDLLAILASARAVFPRVWLYEVVNQGVMIACDWDCAPTPQTIEALGKAPGLAQTLARVGGQQRLLDARLLSPGDIDRMLAPASAGGVDLASYLSTDDNMRLEYDTPRGNVRDYFASLRENEAFLRSFQRAELGRDDASAEDATAH